MEDPFASIDEMIRRLRRQIERIFESMEEQYSYFERLFEERMRAAKTGTMEPLISIQDLGDKLAIVIEMPGTVGSTVNVKLYEDRVVVEGVVDEKVMRDAMGDLIWSRSLSRFKGEYSLPARVDISRAETRRRGSRIIIVAPKKEY